METLRDISRLAMDTPKMKSHCEKSQPAAGGWGDEAISVFVSRVNPDNFSLTIKVE
jgi:hypothetical protein